MRHLLTKEIKISKGFLKRSYDIKFIRNIEDSVFKKFMSVIKLTKIVTLPKAKGEHIQHHTKY